MSFILQNIYCFPIIHHKNTSLIFKLIKTHHTIYSLFKDDLKSEVQLRFLWTFGVSVTHLNVLKYHLSKNKKRSKVALILIIITKYFKWITNRKSIDTTKITNLIIFTTGTLYKSISALFSEGKRNIFIFNTFREGLNWSLKTFMGGMGFTLDSPAVVILLFIF